MQIKDHNHTHQFEGQILSACCCVQVVYPEDRWKLPSAEEMETWSIKTVSTLNLMEGF